MIKIRDFKKADLPKISYLQPTGWEDITYYFNFFEEVDFCFPVVAVADKNIVGVANCLVNQGSGWISHIIVTDKFRKQGIGYKLTKYVMNILSEHNCTTQLLIATQMGENLYEKLGFNKSARYNFYIGKKLVYKKSKNIRGLKNSDYSELLKFDNSLSGEYREAMIKHFISNGYIYIKKDSNNILGYFLPDLGDGVILASTKIAGLELLKFKHSKKKCMTVLPEANKAGNNFFVENGFDLQNQAFRMVYGPEVNWDPSSVFCRIGGFYA